MSYTYTYKKPVLVDTTITPQDIYGPHETPKISGYKIVDFRPPKKGERYLVNNNLQSCVHLTAVDICYGDDVFADYNPRYIVEKTTIIPETLSHMVTVNDVYGGPVEIPEGYRFVDFRPLCKGELYLENTDVTSVDTSVFTYTDYPRIIVEKI